MGRALMAAVTLLLLTAVATAGGPNSGFREWPSNGYGYGYGTYQDYYVRQYAWPVNPQYGYGGRYYGGANSYDEDVRRIQAAHSRARYYSHPMSLMNQPPQYAPRYGWGW